MAVRFTRGGTRADTGLCLRNLNLLAHAQAIELDIGSRCGGHGVCGGDRVKTRKGDPLSRITEAEREHLTAAELDEGWRLACQCYPERDEAEIEAELNEKR